MQSTLYAVMGTDALSHTSMPQPLPLALFKGKLPYHKWGTMECYPVFSVKAHLWLPDASFCALLSSPCPQKATLECCYSNLFTMAQASKGEYYLKIGLS